MLTLWSRGHNQSYIIEEEGTHAELNLFAQALTAGKCGDFSEMIILIMADIVEYLMLLLTVNIPPVK